MDSAIVIGHLLGTATEIAVIAVIAYGIYRLVRMLVEHCIEYRVDYELERKATKDTETEIYKTAAEIEHNLNLEKKEREI